MESTPKNNFNAARFGPSPFMLVGGLLVHPFFWLSVVWGAFVHSQTFRGFLWNLHFTPWRKFLLSAWHFSSDYPLIWCIPVALSLVHVGVRFATSHFAMNEDYLFIQTGLLTLGAPGGPFRVFNDPIPFSTILDANAQKGLFGLLTGTGTLLVATSELRGRYIKLSWVPNVSSAQAAILEKAGVRNARMLSSI